MRGTLDDPPIVIAQDRRKLILLLVGALIFCAGSVSTLVMGAGSDRAIGVIGSIFFGGGAAFAIWMLRHPGSLTLAPDGIIWNTGRQIVPLAWSDIAYFQVFSAGIFSRMPAFYYSPSYQGQKLGRSLSGNMGSFGGAWELSPAKLVALLKDAQARWGASR